MYIKYSVDEKLLLLLEFSVALKALFPGLLHEQIQGSPMKLDDLPWLISDHIALSGVGQFSR